ncbi:unnamed protein product [marine sediment metagenome]|uniref:Uncharacterized protein n=1 Tax=marine sediment metagenome TaxID=412755 RepID=X0TZE9_9ZZZZ
MGIREALDIERIKDLVTGRLMPSNDDKEETHKLKQRMRDLQAKLVQRDKTITELKEQLARTATTPHPPEDD